MKSIVQVNSLNASTRTCPCGASYSWLGPSAIEELRAWTDSHAPHSDGRLKITAGEDWPRVHGKKPRTYYENIA